MELKEYILKTAQAKDICHPWAERIAGVKSVDELLQMYVDGIDFCLANDFPSNNDLVKFAGDKLPDYGICVDKQRLALKNSKFTVLLGSSEAHLHYTGFTVSQLFVKHTSFTEVLAAGNSFVVIDCFDYSRVDVTATDGAKILVNIYGQAKVTTETTGNGIIKIVHKHKNTY